MSQPIGGSLRTRKKLSNHIMAKQIDCDVVAIQVCIEKATTWFQLNEKDEENMNINKIEFHIQCSR